MSRAIVPAEMPEVPDGFIGWARSTKRAGGMFHLHAIGVSACRSIVLERHASQPLTDLGLAAYWGLCPRCVKIAAKGAKA